MALVQLTYMAAEKEKLAGMRFASFNMALVDEIDESIRNWSSPCSLPEQDVVDEELMHFKQDQHHCFEAWRYALILYIHRVFRWDRASPPSGQIKLLARKVVDHIRAFRPSSFVSKQVLMPAFLSGAELADRGFRDTILDYCRKWQSRSGYQPFGDAASLLGDIWKAQEEFGSQPVWWATVMDQKHQAFGPGKRYKLG